MGKVSRPMQVSQSFPWTMVPYRWSHSIKTMAMMCREKDVVSSLDFCSMAGLLYFLAMTMG